MLSSSSSRWQARSSSAHWQPSASRLQGSPAQGLRLFFPPIYLTTRWAAAALVTSSPSPLPATSIHQVCPPLLFPSAARDVPSLALTKLFVFGSDPDAIYYLLTSISFAKIIALFMKEIRKNYRVYMCTPMSYAGSTPAVQFFDLAIQYLRGGVLNPICFLNFFWGSAPRQLRPF